MQTTELFSHINQFILKIYIVNRTNIQMFAPKIILGMSLLALEIQFNIKPRVKWDKYCKITKQKLKTKNPVFHPKIETKPIPIANH